MNLPRPLFLRIRRGILRRIQTRTTMTAATLSGLSYPPRHPYAETVLPGGPKRIRLLAVLAALAILGLFLALTGCAESTTTSTAPDGTVTVIHSRDANSEVLHFTGDTLRAVARPYVEIPPRREKGDSKDSTVKAP